MSASANPLTQLRTFYASSIGKKIVIALTGVAILGFLPAHAIGNLLVFSGADAINEYALFLREVGHGAVLWLFRIGLLAVFLIHIIATVQLTRQNRAARGAKYAMKQSMASSSGSKTMIVSGLVILFFVVYHILHYTVRVWHGFDGAAYETTLADGTHVHDVYKMVIDGFNYIPATLFYLVGISLLCLHLSHGVASVFQTLGIRSDRSKYGVQIFGKAYAFITWAMFASVPLAVMFGFVK